MLNTQLTTPRGGEHKKPQMVRGKPVGYLQTWPRELNPGLRRNNTSKRSERDLNPGP